MLKEKIELSEIVITKNKIVVKSEEAATSFVNLDRIKLPCINKVEDKVKILRRDARRHGVTFYRTETLKILREQKEEYNKAVQDYNNKFDELYTRWAKKLSEGIYTGYRNDDELYKTIFSLQSDISKTFLKDTIINSVLEIDERAKELRGYLEDPFTMLSKTIKFRL